MKKTFSRILLLSIISMLCISAYCFFPLSQPYPAPTGPHAVGMTTTALTGHSKQAIAITWYYPSSTEKNNTLHLSQPLAWQEYKRRKQEKSWVPMFVWNRLLNNLKSYAEPGVPTVPDKKYPVIIFAPSNSSYATYVTYLEELASHGYIIAAVTHPYDDLKQLVNALEEYNNDSTFVLHNKLQLDRIGVLGHADGGKTIANLCSTDSRCKAGISLDWFSPTMPTIKKPFMALLGNDWAHSKEVPHPDLQELDENFLPFVTTDVGANAFSDYVLLRWPLSKLFGVGPHWARNAIADCIRIFFDWYVKNDLQITQTAAKSGAIIVLNGTSSAGKSAIADELQSLYGNRCRVIKLDDFEAFYVVKNPIIAFSGPRKYFTPERLEKRWHDFYSYAKKLALSGYHVFVDTLRFDEDYAKYTTLLGNDQVFKVLVYCPLDVIVDRVKQRSKNKLERRTVAPAVRQFSGIYKLQKQADELIIDSIQSDRMLYALDTAIKELKGMKTPVEERERLRHEFVDQFKLNALKKVVLTPKNQWWDFFVNSGSHSPHDLALMISGYLKTQGL